MECLLAVGGFDPTGGAGITRDLRTFWKLGFFGTSVITVNTCQNTKGVKNLHFVDGNFVIEQIKLIREEFKIRGIKVGIPHKEVFVNDFVSKLALEENIPLIFDPVLSPTFGKTFIDDLSPIKPLLKSALLLTPNFSEYRKLKAFLDNFKGYVLIKGIEEGKFVKDVLVKEGRTIWERRKKKNTFPVRGTGCTYASAILCYVVKGYDLKSAVEKGWKFVHSYRKKAVFEKDLSQGFSL